MGTGATHAGGAGGHAVLRKVDVGHQVLGDDRRAQGGLQLVEGHAARLQRLRCASVHPPQRQNLVKLSDERERAGGQHENRPMLLLVWRCFSLLFTRSRYTRDTFATVGSKKFRAKKQNKSYQTSTRTFKASLLASRRPLYTRRQETTEILQASAHTLLTGHKNQTHQQTTHPCPPPLHTHTSAL